MKRILLVLLLVTLFLLGCGTPSATPAPTPTPIPSPLEPHLLFDWTGMGGDFRDFIVHSERWTLTWEFYPAPPLYGNISANYIGVWLDKTELLANIANVQSNKGQTYSLKGAGAHYIEVNSTGGRWRIYVYDYR